MQVLKIARLRYLYTVSLPGATYTGKMPPLVEAGFRCISNHIGFGKVTKYPANWYTAASHINRLDFFIKKLGLSDITLFVQDWGGPIGLVNAVRNPNV